MGMSILDSLYNKLYGYGAGIRGGYKNDPRYIMRKKLQEAFSGKKVLGTSTDESYDVVNDYGTAAEECLLDAEQGDAEAQYRLGNYYYRGCGVGQDLRKAVEWYTKSSKQGNVNAMCRLGWCYYFGKGVLVDYQKAVEWYMKATEKNDAEAQCAIGDCYMRGYGVEKNYETAVEWYIKAAKQKNIQAIFNLDICCELGEGFNDNNHLEYDKLDMIIDDPLDRYTVLDAARDGDIRARYIISGSQLLTVPKGNDAYLHQGDEHISERILSQCLQVAKEGDVRMQRELGARCMRFLYLRDKAAELFEMAAEQGDSDGLCLLGDYYMDSKHIDYDYGQAVEYYLKAADYGNSKAMLRLADCYEQGKGVPEDEEKMAEWCVAAANKGNVRAQRQLGTCYYCGMGVPEDKNMAAYWYEKEASQGGVRKWLRMGDWYIKKFDDAQKASEWYQKVFEWYLKEAEAGVDEAQFKLAELYFDGDIIGQDYLKAIEWYEKSYKQGNMDATIALGWCYENGVGVSKDYNKAMECYKQASVNDKLGVALWNLGICYYNGYGVENNLKYAEELIKKALNYFLNDYYGINKLNVKWDNENDRWYGRDLLIFEGKTEKVKKKMNMIFKILDEDICRKGMRTYGEWYKLVISWLNQDDRSYEHD